MAYVATAGRSQPQRRQGAIASGSHGGSNPARVITEPTKAAPDHYSDHPDDPLHPLNNYLNYPDGIESAMDAAEVAISLRSAQIARDADEIARDAHEIAARSPRDAHGRRGGQRHRPESAAGGAEVAISKRCQGCVKAIAAHGRLRAEGEARAVGEARAARAAAEAAVRQTIRGYARLGLGLLGLATNPNPDLSPKP